MKRLAMPNPKSANPSKAEVAPPSGTGLKALQLVA
jgi:hypothetical protein